MISPPNETTVSFIVYDFDVDPAEITQKLALEPSSSELGGGKQGLARHWELALNTQKTVELESQISSLLQILEKRIAVVQELAQSYRCIISVGVKYYEFNPEIALDSELLSRLAALKVKLWIDIYNMWDGESDHSPDAHAK
jgi:hypothetical protein